MARIELWNGDICDLEVDAIVSPAATSLWMSTGIAGELKRAGGEAIEFAALRQAPVSLGDAIVTPAGSLAAKVVIHAVSLERDRRTSGPAIDRAARSAMARVRELNLSSVAFPALGTGIGGFPLDEARKSRAAVRDELHHSPLVEHVVFALRGPRRTRRSPPPCPTTSRRRRARCSHLRAGGRWSRPACGRARPRVSVLGRGDWVSFSLEPVDQRREALVETVAREIRLRGLTGPAVPLPRGEPPIPAARRPRDAVLRSGPAGAVRG